MVRNRYLRYSIMFSYYKLRYERRSLAHYMGLTIINWVSYIINHKWSVKCVIHLLDFHFIWCFWCIIYADCGLVQSFKFTEIITLLSKSKQVFFRILYRWYKWFLISYDIILYLIIYIYNLILIWVLTKRSSLFIKNHIK